MPYTYENERDAGRVPVSNVPGRTLYAPTSDQLQSELARLSAESAEYMAKTYPTSALDNFIKSAVVGMITGGALGPGGFGLLSAPAAGAAASAAGQLATGKDLESALKAAALSYVGGQISSNLPNIKFDVQTGVDAAGNPITQKLPIGSIASNKLIDLGVPESLADTLGTATQGGVKSLAQQGIGSLITGQRFDPAAAFLSGAVSAGTKDLLAGSKELNQLPPILKDTVTKAVMAGALGKNPTAAALNSLIGQAMNAVTSGPTTGTTATKVAEAGGPDFGANAIIEPGDMGGTIVPGEAGEDFYDPNTVYVTGQGEPADLLSLLGVDTSSTGLPTSVVSTTTPKADETVKVTGNTLKTGDDMLDSLLNDVFVATGPGQSVDVTGKKFINPVGDADTQRVNVETTTFPTEADEVVTTKGTDDVTDQKVDVTDTRLTKDDTTTTTTPTTTTVTPTVTTTTSPPGGGPVTKTTAYKPWTPIPEAQAQQPFRPGLADVFYGKGALEFGPGAAAMADVADFQGRKAQARRSMELALDAAGGENQADDAYERLMSLAKESPAATVQELMNIIEGGRNA